MPAEEELKERDRDGSGDRSTRDAKRSVLEPIRAELSITVFLTGAAVILIEILGTRVIGPVFGVSLFVWSALLAVTLASLAVGYYAGGLLVDRKPTGKLLGVAVLASGLLLSTVALVRVPVLRLADGVGQRGGAILAATLLFAPCLTVLGMAGPIAVRLAMTDLYNAGRGVGVIYAISTAGSLLAAILTGFFLVPAFEIDQILLGAAAVLILLGAILLLMRGWRFGFVALAVPAFASTTRPPQLPSGVRIVAHAQSLYGLVQVVEDDNRGVRFLRADHSVIGAQWIRDQTSGFDFTHILESVRFLRPAARDLLQIGLGTGALASALRSSGINIDVVEIDPAVVQFAQRYFGFSVSGQIDIEDARTFVRRSHRSYDIIVHDTFTGGTTPEHLLSLEVLREARRLLRPGGVLVVNFAGYDTGPEAEASFAVMRTLRSVFAHVRAFRDGPPETRRHEATNLIFFSSDGDLNFVIPANTSFENEDCAQTIRSFQNWEVLERVPEGSVITDDHNPLGRLQLAVAQEHFRMNELLPLDVWLQ